MKGKYTLNGKSTEEKHGACNFTPVWKGAVTVRSQHDPWGHTATQRIGFVKMKKKNNASNWWVGRGNATHLEDLDFDKILFIDSRIGYGFRMR